MKNIMETLIFVLLTSICSAQNNNITNIYYTILTKNGLVSDQILNKPVVLDGTYFYQSATQKKYGLLDLNGKKIFENDGEIITYSRKHVVVKRNDAIGAVNKSGEYSIKSGEYTEIGPLINEYTWAKKNDKYFFIDRVGKITSEPIDVADIVGSFNKNGIALVKKAKEQWGYISYKGEFLTNCIYVRSEEPYKITWETTDDYADHTILQAYEYNGKKEEYKTSHFFPNLSPIKNSFLKKYNLMSGQPKLANLDNDANSFYFSYDGRFGIYRLVDQNGNMQLDNLGDSELQVKGDTVLIVCVYRVSGTEDTYKEDVKGYVYNGKSLSACNNCAKLKNLFVTETASYNAYKKNIMETYRWNDFRMDINYINGSHYFKNKENSIIKGTDFEEFESYENDYVILKSELILRAFRENRLKPDNSKSSSKISERWTSAVTEYLNIYEIFSKAFNSYKSSTTTDKRGNVSYWLTKLIDANTTITNILGNSNDGSMSREEQEKYYNMAIKKGEELQKFRDNLGKSNISILEAIVIGLSR